AGLDHAGEAGRSCDAARRRAAGLDRREDVRAALGSGGHAGEEVHGPLRGPEVTRAMRVLGALVPLLATTASAHEPTMAEMELRQLAPHDFLWQWTVSGVKPAGQELTPVWPEGCTTDGDPETSNLLRCAEAGLAGTLRIDGVGRTYSAAIVKVHWQDGQRSVYTLTA